MKSARHVSYFLFLFFSGVLNTLWLGNNNIGPTGATALADALKVNGVLNTLNLEWNDIRAAGAAVIAEALRVNGVLTTLNLQANNIGDEGAAAFSEALAVNGVLKHLDLRYNDLGGEGREIFSNTKQIQHSRVIWGLEPCSRARETCRQGCQVRANGGSRLAQQRERCALRGGT